MSPPAGADRVTAALLRDWPLPHVADDADKHDRGTVLVAGGTGGTPGAVLLAGMAALRVGAGRLQVATGSGAGAALGVALPEALVLDLPEDRPAVAAGLVAEAAARGCGALVLGPGLPAGGPSAELVTGVLERVPEVPLVLDAGALAALEPHSLRDRPGPTVLTPNPDELDRLLPGGDPAKAAAEFHAVVLTKGCVAAPDGRSWPGELGGAGLGTSGSGDVLAGAVGGLLARGAPPEQAAVYGQYLHAAAGERLAARLGRLGFLARELLDELPLVLDSLEDT